MARIAVGIFAVATLTAGILLRRRAVRPEVVSAEDPGYDVNALYEAGL